jgi:hypothetical protein
MNSTNALNASSSDTGVLKAGQGGSYPTALWGLTPWVSWTAPSLCDSNGSLYTLAKQAVRCALQTNITTTTVSGVGGLPTDTTSFGVSSSTGQNMNAQTPNKVVALLIQQGENEMTISSVTRDIYRVAHLALIDDFRATFGASIPVICGGFTDPLFNVGSGNLMSIYGWNSTNYAKAIDFQDNYWNSTNSTTGFLGLRSFTGYAPGTGLSYSPVSQPTKYIHFDSVGHRKMGVRMYKSYLSSLNNVQNYPVTILGTPTATVGTYNASTNAYPVTINFITTGTPVTANLYSGTNLSGTLLLNGASVVSGVIVSVSATPSGFTQSFYLYLTNSFNTTPAAATISCSIPIPTPTVSLATASATASSLIVQGSSVNASSIVITSSPTYNTGTTYGTITPAQFASQFTITGLTFAIGNTYTIYAFAVNTIPLTSTSSSQSVSVITYNEYPPVALGFATLTGTPAGTTGVSQSITISSGAAYGLGTYVVSASSCAGTNNTSGFCPNNGFDKLTSGTPAKSWASTDGTAYTSASGVSPSLYTRATKASTTVSTPSGTRDGEWLQIQLPVSILLNNYTISRTFDFTTSPSGAGNSPFEWFLVASNNGTTWTQIDTRTGVNNWETVNTNPYTISGNTTAYSYYRLIITKVRGAGAGGATVYYGIIGDWALFG